MPGDGPELMLLYVEGITSVAPSTVVWRGWRRRGAIVGEGFGGYWSLELDSSSDLVYCVRVYVMIEVIIA